MGILGSLLQKHGKEKEKLGICIPDAARAKRQEAVEAKKDLFPQAITDDLSSPTRGFLVTGIFHVQDVLMAQGIAGQKIKKRDKAKFAGATMIVKEIKIGTESAGSIVQGQKGALFLKPEKGKFPVLKQGDELEF